MNIKSSERNSVQSKEGKAGRLKEHTDGLHKGNEGYITEREEDAD